jgi:hypothetical protein
MYCVKCGGEIADDVQFCPKCGTAVKSAVEITANISERRRHGFTSFWLILGLIGCFIVGSIYLFSPNLIGQYYVNASKGLIMLFGIISMANIICYILLLCWKRIGFWIFIGTSIVSLPLNMAIGLNIGQTLSGLIGLVILWGILHIRKNGKTAWEQLE